MPAAIEPDMKQKTKEMDEMMEDNGEGTSKRPDDCS
jgi:hypothetical protein